MDDKRVAEPMECDPALQGRYCIGSPIDPQKLEEEKRALQELNTKPWYRRLAGYTKFMGPGFIQSAVTLGAGSAGSCLIAGSTYGYRLLWVQPLAMILGMFMFFAMARQTLLVQQRPYEAMKRHIHPLPAFLFGLSALLATIIWHFPQYSLAGDVTNDLAGLVTKTSNPLPGWVLGPVLLIFSTLITWNYGKGIRGIKLFERTMKILVWVIVAAFALVVLRTGLNWKELFSGLVPRLPRLPDGTFDRQQTNLMIGLLGATVGVNMVFLYPYSMMARGWVKDHLRLAYSDLLAAMCFPFILATGFVILATSNTLYKRGNIESGNTPGDTDVVVNVGTMAAGSNVTVSFDVLIPKTLATAAEEISCQARLSGEGLGALKSDDPETPEVGDATVTVLGRQLLSPGKGKPSEKMPEVVAANRGKLLTDRDNNGVLSAGDTLRYELMVKNNRESALTNLLVNVKPDPNTRLLSGSVESRTITRSAVEAVRVLEPLVGLTFGRIVFGLGMLAIALSSITVQMLMCAFVLSEMFGISPTGWRYRLMVLTPAIGAFGVVWRQLPFGVGVFASSTCVILLPMAYICFMILHNKKKYMGDAMPRGGKRLFWNAGMALAITIVTLSALVTISIKYSEAKERFRKPRQREAVAPKETPAGVTHGRTAESTVFRRGAIIGQKSSYGYGAKQDPRRSGVAGWRSTRGRYSADEDIEQTAGIGGAAERGNGVS